MWLAIAMIAQTADEYLETRFIKPTRELITQVVHHFCWH
jgi:acetylornithine deacetylase